MQNRDPQFTMMRWLRLVLDAVFPADCEACGAPLTAGERSCVCAQCRGAMRPVPEPACTSCGAPLASTDSCSSCLRHPPAFTTARAAALYLPSATGLNPLASAIQALKYRGRRHVADALGALLAERYPYPADAVLVPIPLHLTRLRARGFNQAALLAQALGRRRGLAVAPRLLARTRPTPAQAGLTASARRRNLHDAFAVRPREDVPDRPIVLVDDVLTTGATADACARALLAAGAERVAVYTVGRAP
jgi:ComF family protein